MNTEEYHADELAKESAVIIRDIIDEYIEDRATIIDKHRLRKIFEKRSATYFNTGCS